MRFEQEMEMVLERVALSNREEVERLRDLAPSTGYRSAAGGFFPR